MVTTNEGAPSSSDPSSDSGTALSKLRQTLSSSLMTAQDKGKSQLVPSADWAVKPLVAGVSPRSCGLHLLPVYVVYGGKSGNRTGFSSEDFRFPLSASIQFIRTYHTDRLLIPLNLLPRTYMGRSAFFWDVTQRRLVQLPTFR